MTLPTLSSVARLVAPITTSVAGMTSACVRATTALVVYVSRDDRVHHDPLSENWNWSWLAEVDE